MFKLKYDYKRTFKHKPISAEETLGFDITADKYYPHIENNRIDKIFLDYDMIKVREKND